MGEILAVDYHYIVSTSMKRVSNTLLVFHWWNFSYSKSFHFVFIVGKSSKMEDHH